MTGRPHQYGGERVKKRRRRAPVPRFRAEAAAAGRDPSALKVLTFGTMPTEAKLAHYAELGVDECVLRLPSAGRDEILRTLDGYAEVLPR